MVSVRAARGPCRSWAEQVRQAVTAYVQTIQERPAITLSWIRGLPALGDGARPVLRRGFGLLTAMIVDLTGNPGFRRAASRRL